MSVSERAPAGTRTVTATEARVHFGEMLRIVREQGGPVIVERAGEPEAALISIDDLRELQRLRPDQPRRSWSDEMMELHAKIAAEWQGPHLTAEDVDDAINFGQR